MLECWLACSSVGPVQATKAVVSAVLAHPEDTVSLYSSVVTVLLIPQWSLSTGGGGARDGPSVTQHPTGTYSLHFDYL